MGKSRIEKYLLCFRGMYGKENREKVAQAFVDFWLDQDVEEMVVPGHCMFSGMIYDDDRFQDGDMITTSNVVTFRRINCDTVNGQPHDLMCAITKSGTEYYFYSDDFCGEMFLMLGDLLHLGSLSNEPEYYLRNGYDKRDFI